MKQITQKVHKNGIKEACAFLTLPDLVYGIIFQDFNYDKIQLSEVYAKVGRKLSIDRKITRTCLILLVEQGLVEFKPMGRTPYIVRCCNETRRN